MRHSFLACCAGGSTPSHRSLRGTIVLIGLLALVAGCSGAPDVTEFDNDLVANAEDRPADLGQIVQALTCNPSQEDRVGNGFSMNTAVSYDTATGGASMTTTLRNSRSLVGFTGGVIVVFLDADARPLYATELQKFGLDACGFRCPRKRTVVWQDTVPPEFLDRVAAVAILQDHTATNRALFKSLNIVQRVAAACSTAGQPQCTAVALGALLADPILHALTDLAMQETVDDMFSSMASRAQMCL